MSSNKIEKQPRSARQAAAADQYFTRVEVARQCLETMIELIGAGRADSHWWVEPSAGSGSFLGVLTQKSLCAWGGDIDPQHPDVAKHNYLVDPLPSIPSDKAGAIVIGNPPFGKKSKLAVEFINQALDHAGLVGFIVPIQLRKWSAQKQVNQGARLILDLDLPENAFLFMGKPYKLRCCFQVWTTWPQTSIQGNDLRLKSAPKTTHNDFEAWQYNCTQEARKFFDYDWDFAVLRQGYGDFSILYPPEQRNNLDRRKQWIFIKSNNQRALSILRGLDFQELSQRNTGTPGFGKADLVDAYSTASSTFMDAEGGK